VVFIAAPFPIPEELRHVNLPLQLGQFNLPENTFWVGVALLLTALAYVALSALRHKPLRFFRWQIPLPPLKLTLCQIVIACGDLLVAAAVLHTLLPPVEGGYLRVVGVFMLAFVSVVLSHVPGGYGVLELTILRFLPEEHAPAVFAAMLVFRVIYYWVPLMIAAAMLGYHELTLRSDATEKPLPAGSSSATAPPPERRTE
jgi:uncharacterized membrane protein YbhN (UPF0104 family)